MERKNVTLSIDEELWTKAREEYKMSLSAFLELRLVEYFALREGKVSYNENQQNNPEHMDNTHINHEKGNVISNSNQHSNRKVGLLRFELKSMAPEATRIPSYPTGPI